MRVLFLGDLAATGFGTVTMDLGQRLLSRGLDVRFVSQNDTGGQLAEPFHSRTLSMLSLWQVVNELTGEAGVEGANDIIGDVIAGTTKAGLTNGQPWGDWKPEAGIILGDFGTARHIVARSPRFAEIPFYHYVPIEGVDLPPTLVTDLWSVTRPVAMTNFGADQIETLTGVRPPMIYHGVDTAAFHPVKPSQPVSISADGQPTTRLTNRDQCKLLWAAWFGMKMPRRWLLRTDRHMPRKNYNALIRAMGPVLLANPDTALIIHCNATDQGGSLPDSVLKLPDARAVTSSHQEAVDVPKPLGYALFGRDYPQVVLTNLSGLSREMLVSLYNAADLYVSNSAEGFGLTIAEALACGVPAVGLDFSAVPEVIGPAGVLVPPAYLYDNIYDHLWAAVDEQRFAVAVHTLLNDTAKRETLGRKGPRHVSRMFSWETAANQFADLLTQPANPVEEAA